MLGKARLDGKPRSRDNHYHRAPPRIDLNLLDVLHTVVEERSVSRAAARLGVTQPAVSNALSRLRHQVGDPLFLKTGSGMEPTARAIELVAPVREALDAMSSAVEAARHFDPLTYRGEFAIAGVDYATHVFVPRFAQRLRERAPGSRIRIARLHGAPRHVFQAADDHHIVLPDTHSVAPDLPAKTLVSDQWRLLVREGHPLEAVAMPTAADASRHTFVVSRAPDDELRAAADRNLAALGLRRRTAVTVPSCAFVGAVVEATDHIALIPTRLADRYAREHRVRVLPSPIPMATMEVHMQWHPRHDRSPLHRWLRDCALEVAGSL
jgi:DNA-binding transcriptional LysR family regulator